MADRRATPRRGRALPVAAAVLLTLVTLAALFAPLIAGDPNLPDLTKRLSAPSSVHLMGTDELGRDVFARVIFGARVSLAVAFLAAAAAFLIGTTVGAIAGYFGGVVDWIVLRLIELALCFPFLLLALAILAVAGPSVSALVLALALTSWTTEARFVRGEMLRVRESEFAAAARASGAGALRIVFRHLLPHALPPAIVSAGFGVASAILAESALSFLGFGVPLPLASWGSILSSADDHLATAWWLALFPGLAVFATVASVNVIADQLRRTLNAKLDLVG